MTRFRTFGPAAAAALLSLGASAAHAAIDSFAVGGTTGGSALALFASAASTGTASTASTTLTTSSTVTPGQTQTQVATDFLTQTLTPAATGGSTTGSDTTGELSVYVQSASALRNPLSVNLRSSTDLALWNLVASIQAQQLGSPFDLVDTGVTAFQLSALDTDISAVPLPASAWLFVMGLLGLAGTRLTGQSSQASRSRTGDRERSDALQPVSGSYGAAVAA